MGFSVSKSWARFVTRRYSRECGKEKMEDISQCSTYGPAVSRYSSESPSLFLPRCELEDRIVGLWRRVWLGLYEIDMEESRYHSDRLKALYYGAGLMLSRGTRKDIYELLIRRFSRFCPTWDNGIASLKLSDGLSIFTLYAIYEVLIAYESDIPQLEQIYSILQKRQLGLDGLHVARSSPLKMEFLKKEFNKIARPMGQRIAVCDIRINALNDYTREELGKQQQSGKSGRSEYIYDMAFPERLRGGFCGPSR